MLCQVLPPRIKNSSRLEFNVISSSHEQVLHGNAADLEKPVVKFCPPKTEISYFPDTYVGQAFSHSEGSGFFISR